MLDSSTFYSLAADTLLVTHVLFVVFVVLGLLLVYVGKLRFWSWVRNPWFRMLHLLAIGVVVVQSWFGIICPLTTWEMSLRAKAGMSVYQGSFISHWLQELLYYQFPFWVFVVCYTVFGGLVVLSWFVVRPRSFTTNKKREGC
jgi:hypothetical protein